MIELVHCHSTFAHPCPSQAWSDCRLQTADADWMSMDGLNCVISKNDTVPVAMAVATVLPEDGDASSSSERAAAAASRCRARTVGILRKDQAARKISRHG